MKKIDEREIKPLGQFVVSRVALKAAGFEWGEKLDVFLDDETIVLKKHKSKK